MNDQQGIIIAIDGYSSCGKSTLAKDLAAHLNYRYIDSGAMYRAVCLYCLDNNIDVKNKNAVISVLDNIHIHFENINGVNNTFLNGLNIENKIRSLRVSSKVSEVSTIPEVRVKLVDFQTKMGSEKSIVMDGRDITSVVFPQAELKLFVTADVDTRVQRRYKELRSKGQEVTYEEVKKNLTHRDHMDTTRAHSPLLKVKDVYVIDNTYLNRQEQLQVALKYMEFITT